jgi:reactive intermediate/imine deaminase
MPVAPRDPLRPQRIQSAGLGRLPAFSHASLSEDLIFVSGTLGTRGESFQLVDGGVASETRQAMENIRHILESCQATFEHILHCRVYLTDMNGFQEMNEAYLKCFPAEPPSRITVGCSALALGAAVEIECVAQRPRGGNEPRQGLPRESSFVEHEGERLYFESVGEGESLVLCHGAGGNHAVWYQQVPVFARTRRVITWDHRGFGRSTDSTGESGPDLSVRDLAAILDHLRVDRVDLVGQSMGGWTALGFTLEHRDRVRSLTLADTLGGITSPAIQRGFEELSARLGDGRIDAGGLGHHPALDDSLVGRDPGRAYLYQMLGGFGEPDLAAIVPRLFSTTRSQDVLATLGIPVLFIVGDRDPLFPPHLVREAAKQIPDVRLVEIPGCGHSPYFEAPEAWNAVLGQFLTSCER